MAKNILFSSLEPQQMSDVMGAMKKVECQTGDKLITQGDVGDQMYIVETGKFDILVKGVGNVGVSGAGGSFGELSLMMNQNRAATVRARRRRAPPSRRRRAAVARRTQSTDRRHGLLRSTVCRARALARRSKRPCLYMITIDPMARDVAPRAGREGPRAGGAREAQGQRKGGAREAQAGREAAPAASPLRFEKRAQGNEGSGLDTA